MLHGRKITHEINKNREPALRFVYNDFQMHIFLKEGTLSQLKKEKFQLSIEIFQLTKRLLVQLLSETLSLRTSTMEATNTQLTHN